MKSTNFKQWLPHIAAIFAFFVMTALYFGPVFQGKDLMQTDAINSQGWGKDLRDSRSDRRLRLLVECNVFGNAVELHILAATGKCIQGL